MDALPGVKLMGGSYHGLIVSLEPSRRFLRLTAPGRLHDWYETYSLANPSLLEEPGSQALMYCVDRRA